MTMYHPTKFGCKKISSLVDTVETVRFDYMSPHLDLHLENSKPIFLHNTLAHGNDVHHHIKFSFKRFSNWGDIIQMNIHWNFEPSCDLYLDHNKAIQSFHKTIQFIMTCHKTKFSYKRTSSSEDILESQFYYMILHCDLEDSKSIFLKDTLAMVMHHHIKFGSKRFTSSEQTNINILKFCFDLDHSNPISS